MIHITATHYREIAALLAEQLEGKSLFNGAIEYDTDEFYSTLHCTLILCRDAESDSLLSVLPVWWDYNLYQADGEVYTDFSWRELAPALEV